MSYTERLRLVRSWNQLSGKRTKGIGPNEFPKKGMSDQSGVFRPFYVVERVRRIVGESRANLTLPRLWKSFAWALGPPIEMKIEPSRVYDQAGVDGKDRGNPG